MLDKLPPAVRHALFALVAALLVWLQDALPGIASLPEAAKAVIATIVTILLAYLTPLTQQYGVGAPPSAVDTGERDATPPPPGYKPRHDQAGDDPTGRPA